MSAMWTCQNGLETAAGHISSRRLQNSLKRASTCAFAAPGVGLEPTTYGFTVLADTS
jgi:hypothetical protein